MFRLQPTMVLPLWVRWSLLLVVAVVVLVRIKQFVIVHLLQMLLLWEEIIQAIIFWSINNIIISRRVWRRKGQIKGISSLQVIPDRIWANLLYYVANNKFIYLLRPKIIMKITETLLDYKYRYNIPKVKIKATMFISKVHIVSI